MYVFSDIKPANLLINLKGDVKVSDMGIVRQVDPAIDKNHLVHTYIGTTTYMSPERLDAKDYSYSSDIWSFGMTMLTVSFGRLPRQVEGGRYWTILSNLLEQPSPSLADDDNPEHLWSEEYQHFIALCLRKDPHERPSAQELLSHPFLQQAFPESHDQGSVEKLGVQELDSLLNALCVHLTERRDTPALDVFICLQKPPPQPLPVLLPLPPPGQAVSDSCWHETGSGGGEVSRPPSVPVTAAATVSDTPVSTTLDVFNITVLEALQALLFAEYPCRVLERVRVLRADQLKRGQGGKGRLCILHRFLPSTGGAGAGVGAGTCVGGDMYSSNPGCDKCTFECACHEHSTVDDDMDDIDEDVDRGDGSSKGRDKGCVHNCGCRSSGEGRREGRREGSRSRLAGLAEQLHLPLSMAEHTARKFLQAMRDAEETTAASSSSASSCDEEIK